MNSEKNKSTNRSFGIVFFIVFLIIGTYPMLNGEDVRLWSLIFSFIFLILGILNSEFLSPLNKIWFKFGIFLGKIFSPLIMALIFFFVFLLISIYPIVNEGSLRIWSLIISLIFLILGLVNSKILTPLNQAWFRFGVFLGKIISPIVMSLIFFLVVTPIGLIMRICKKDLLNLKFNYDSSYWIENVGPKSKMKNQF